MHILRGAIKRYDWGSRDAIPAILNIDPSDEPLAEYWLGAHPAGSAETDEGSLIDLIATHPSMVSARASEDDEPRLPFMIKLLSASRPLSLQAHPNRADAQAGFARENADDIPLDAAHRTFKDPWDKPELLVALSDFDALAGFRDPHLTLDLFDQLGVLSILEPIIAPLREREAAAGLAQVFLDFLILDKERSDLLTSVVVAAVDHLDDPGPVGDFARTAVLLDQHFPSDPSLLAALLLNRKRLAPGEAIHIRPGQMHAYLSGTGVEILGNSDNVLRGGLTHKHIDPSALVKTVTFTPGMMPVLMPRDMGNGLWHYDAREQAFTLWRAELNSDGIDLPASDRGRIVLITSGEAHLNADDRGYELVQGESAFVEAGEILRLSGTGQAFIAASGVA